MRAEIFLARNLILALWIIGALYWVLAAQSAKPVRRRAPVLWRLAFLGQAAVTAVLLGPHSFAGWLGAQVIGGGWTRFWIAASIVTAGLALAIWARRTLAGNWSGAITVKEGHELVRSGPYRRVRHPIYSGVLLMMLGTALASGRTQGLIALVIALITLYVKARVEEHWMESEFPTQYADYRKSSWSLIPLLL
jgi:protein-S-isoprenylcysteine O-methyltransferase Ste14